MYVCTCHLKYNVVMSSDYDQRCPEIVVSTVLIRLVSTVLIRYTHCEFDISVHVIKCLVIVYISLFIKQCLP